jgi:hypothetical protein
MATVGRGLWARVTITLAALLCLGSTPAPAAGAQDLVRATSCSPTRAVVGMHTPGALRVLKRQGCTHVVVRNRCADIADFGLVVAVKPARGSWPSSTKVTIWRGVRDAGSDCGALGGNSDPFDGVYALQPTVGEQMCTVGTTTTSSPIMIFPAGGVFVVSSGAFDGAVITGSIDRYGVSRARLVSGSPLLPDLNGTVTITTNAEGTLSASGIFTGAFTSGSGAVCTITQQMVAVRQAG